MKKNKGFTLAELLVVVAIIAVLVAISIPIFTAQLEKAREATDLANIRAAYAEIMNAVIQDDAQIDNNKEPIIFMGEYYYPLKSNNNVYTKTYYTEPYFVVSIEVTQKIKGWQLETADESLNFLFPEDNGEHIEEWDCLDDNNSSYYVYVSQDNHGTFVSYYLIDKNYVGD